MIETLWFISYECFCFCFELPYLIMNKSRMYALKRTSARSFLLNCENNFSKNLFHHIVCKCSVFILDVRDYLLTLA